MASMQDFQISCVKAITKLVRRSGHLIQIIRFFMPVRGQVWIYQDSSNADLFGFVSAAFDDVERCFNPNKNPFDDTARTELADFPFSIQYECLRTVINVQMKCFDELLRHYNIAKEISSATTDSHLHYGTMWWWDPERVEPIDSQLIENFELATDGLNEAAFGSSLQHSDEKESEEVWMTLIDAADCLGFDAGHVSRLAKKGDLEKRGRGRHVEISKSSLTHYVFNNPIGKRRGRR